MKDFFILIILLIIFLPAVLFATKKLFGKSIVYFVANLFAVLNVAGMVLFFVAGKFGNLFLFIAIPVCLVGFIVFFYILYRKIQKPLISVAEKLEHLSNGKLYVAIDAELANRADEFGYIESILDTLIIRLRDLVGNIHDGSAQVSSSSMDMTRSSMQVSQSANQQASSIEEVSASMEQMLANISQNAHNAQETERISVRAVTGISVVSKSVDGTADSMRRISEKITLVNEIARKTTLLAINASIEATLAGEQGKGFAVVAEEVRKLAIISQQAAKEIEDISSKGLGVADRSSKLLQTTIPDINKTAELLREIKHSSLEQESGAQQVNNAVQQLNAVAQSNTTISEEMASNAEELSTNSERLKEIVSYFETEETNDKKDTVEVLSNEATELLEKIEELKSENDNLKKKEKEKEDSEGRNEGVDIDLDDEKDMGIEKL